MHYYYHDGLGSIVGLTDVNGNAVQSYLYDEFGKWFQKCLVHLLRKAKFEAEKYPKKNIVNLHEQLKSLYEEIVDFLKKDPPLDLRIEKKKEFEKKLNEIINYRYWCKEAKSIIDNRLKAYRNHWLTAIEIEV